MTIENISLTQHDSITICFKCQGSGLKPQKAKLEATFCTVCSGTGKPQKMNSKQRKRKPFRPFKFDAPKFNFQYVGDTCAHDLPHLHRYGPKPLWDPINNPSDLKKIMDGIEDDIMLTSLCGRWMIYQIEHGHRTTTDDCALAAIIVQHFKSNHHVEKLVERYIDLGTGLSSVLQLVSWGLELQSHNALIVGLEAQEKHASLARRTCTHNGLVDAHIIHGDIRDLYTDLLQDTICLTSIQKYDLITGTPPYFPISNGPLPTLTNRALCSFEFRGDVSAYLDLASLLLSPTGSCFIANGGTVDRTQGYADKVGFKCIQRWDIHGKVGKPCLFSIYHFKFKNTDGVADKSRDCPVQDVHVRDVNGQFTETYLELMSLIGKPKHNSFEPGSVPKGAAVKS